MAIQSGTHLGPYEIVSAIGAGGMGEVYRARDAKLGRDVAIKVLPEVFAGDAARMARFQREARVLASLSHPNIATIYGLEDSGSTRALVMELVEGPTLADRIKQGPIPVDEAIRIARQIADALEYAHERGIIHRDLKPANIKVTADDAVKVLDFGLAKALEGDTTSIDISTSPTISRMATQQGVLLGTAAYMSPEQAKAKPVDRRADIWAFGCVLYEVLTGKQAFTGETVTDTLAAVIRAEPDWSQLPAATPMRVRVLLQRCLQKDPKQRLQAIGDARISLDEVIAGAPEGLSGLAVTMPFWRRALPWALFTAATVAAVALGWVLSRTATTLAPPDPMRLEISIPGKGTITGFGALALSPDGRQLAFAASGTEGVMRLWIRSLDSLEVRSLTGSEMPATPIPFFWSPDSKFIGFFSEGKLKKINTSSSAVETVCDVQQGAAVGGSWNRDGVIVYGQAGGGLMRVSAGGGVASPLTIVDRSHGEFHHILPWFLPDGRHFIYQRVPPRGIYLGSLDTKPEEQDSKPLIANALSAEYVPSSDPSSGYVLFLRGNALMAQAFNARRLALTGEPVTVVNHVGVFRDFGYFSASNSDALVYWTAGSATAQLRWFDRQGQTLGTPLEIGPEIESMSLNPRGTVAAVGRAGFLKGDLWLADFSRDTSTRFTFDSGESGWAVWSFDGSRIVFASSRTGHYDLYQKLASGAGDEELLLKSDEDKVPSSWSRDGRFLLYTVGNLVGPKPGTSIWVLPFEGDKKPFPFIRTQFDGRGGQFSPDGRWIAYTSDESGRDEVYVQTFSPNPAGAASGTETKVLISTGGGTVPRWRGDGKELYYISPEGTLMAVDVANGPRFQAGLPKALFRVPMSASSASFAWDLASDGTRFLFPAPPEQGSTPFSVVLNWPSLLKK